MSCSLVDLFLGELLCYEPAFAKHELPSVENTLNILTLFWRHEVGFGEYSDAARCGFAEFDETESSRRFNIIVSAYSIVSSAQLSSTAIDLPHASSTSDFLSSR